MKSYTGGSSTYIDSSASTTNYSTGTFAVVQNASDIDDALLMFNLSGTTVSGTVSAATLSLEPDVGNDQRHQVYALSKPWTASQATYKNATTSTTWQTPAALGSSDYSSTLLGTLPPRSKAGIGCDHADTPPESASSKVGSTIRRRTTDSSSAGQAV